MPKNNPDFNTFFPAGIKVEGEKSYHGLSIGLQKSSSTEIFFSNHQLRKHNYTSYFFQHLFIQMAQNATVQDDAHIQKGLSFLLDRYGDVFFPEYSPSNKSSGGFFIDQQSGNTVLTALSKLDFVATLAETLLNKAYSKLGHVVMGSAGVSNFLTLLAHKNNLGETALLIAILKKNKELVDILLNRIKDSVIASQSEPVFSLLFGQVALKQLRNTSVNVTTLLDVAIVYSHVDIVRAIINTVDVIYGVRSRLFSHFITNHESFLSPMLLSFSSDKFEECILLLQAARLAYSKNQHQLFDYMTQRIVLRDSPLKHPSLLGLALDKPNNMTSFITLLMDMASDAFDSSGSLLFDYFSLQNSKGESILHVASEASVNNKRFFLEKLSGLFNKKDFLRIVDQRDYYGFTPLLVAWRDEKVLLASLLQEYDANPDSRPYQYMGVNDHFERSITLATNLQIERSNPSAISLQSYYRNSISFYDLTVKEANNNVFFTNRGTHTPELADNTQQIYKESIFNLIVFMVQHPTARDFVANAYSIRRKERNNKRLSRQEKQQLFLYQEAVDAFDYYIRLNKLPCFNQFTSFSDDFYNERLISSAIWPHWDQLFLNGDHYLLVHRIEKDLIVVKKEIGRHPALFSSSLFHPLKSLRLDKKIFNNGSFLLWIKKYFFIDYINQKYTICTFNASAFNHYVPLLELLNLKIIMTDDMFLEESVNHLPRRIIQSFFLLEKKFISILDFNVKDFFYFYQKDLSFRVERIESHFFKLTSEEKRALQKILQDYPIAYENYEFVFSDLVAKGYDLGLQRDFLEAYGKKIIEKIRDVADITQFDAYTSFQMSIKAYLDVMDIELAHVEENPDYLLHMFRTVRANFERTSHIDKRNILAYLGKAFQFLGRAAIAPFISSMPYVIRAIAKLSQAYGATEEILSAMAPWMDFLISKLFANVDKLPAGIARHIVNYIEKCYSCSNIAGRVAKNFPVFSFFILLKSLSELISECHNKKEQTINFYCINMIVNQVLSTALIGVEVQYADHLRYVLPYYLLGVFTLTGHSISIEAYHRYSTVYDKWNLSERSLETRLRVYLGLAVGIYDLNDPNYATLGISTPQQVFAAFENFIDFQRDQRKVYIYRAAIMVPKVLVVTGKTVPLKENKEGIQSTNVFKIDKLANFEFIFGNNKTFCHDTTVIDILPDHKKKFIEEYDIALGTFTEFPDITTGLCSRGKKITSDSLALASDSSSASILANNLSPATNQVHQKLHYANNKVLFALADPAAVANYSLTFTDEYRGEFDFIVLMLKRLIVLEAPSTDHQVARFTVTGLKSADARKLKTMAYIIAAVSWAKTEIILHPLEHVSLMQEFHFHRLEEQHTFYFDGDVLTTKKGFSIVNLKETKKLAFNMGSHFLSTQHKVVSIPCGTTFHALELQGVSPVERVSLSRLACHSQNRDYFSVRLGRHTQFIYNDTLVITINTSSDVLYPTLYIRIQESALERQFRFDHRSVAFDKMQAISSHDNLLLEFSMNKEGENATGTIDLRLTENAQNELAFCVETIIGFWSAQNNRTIGKLQVIKEKDRTWQSELFIEEPYTSSSEPDDKQQFEFDMNTFATKGYDRVYLSRGGEHYALYYFFRGTNIPEIEGNFKQYRLLKNSTDSIVLHLIQKDTVGETYVLLPLACNQIIIDHVYYFISIDSDSLLAIKFDSISRFHHALLAPLRIPTSLEAYLSDHPRDPFPVKRVAYLQFDDELVPVQYLKYYRLYKNTSLSVLASADASIQNNLLLDAKQSLAIQPVQKPIRDQTHAIITGLGITVGEFAASVVGGMGVLVLTISCYRRLRAYRGPAALPAMIETIPMLVAMNPLQPAQADFLDAPVLREYLTLSSAVSLTTDFVTYIDSSISFGIQQLKKWGGGIALFTDKAANDEVIAERKHPSIGVNNGVSQTPYFFTKTRSRLNSEKKHKDYFQYKKAKHALVVENESFHFKTQHKTMDISSVSSLDTDGLLLLSYLVATYYRGGSSACCSMSFFSPKDEIRKKIDPVALQVIHHGEEVNERFSISS